MKNNKLLTSLNTKKIVHSFRLFAKNTSLYAMLLGLFFTSTLLIFPFSNIAEAVELPYKFEISWAKHDDYIILNLTLDAQEGQYTYAPNQADVYPTAFTLNINPSEVPPIKDIPILFPIGIKKPDPLDKSVQVYVYEKSQNIFMIFPSDFAPLFADLDISFLACSAVRCQPLKTSVSLINQGNFAEKNFTKENMRNAQDFPWFGEFEKRFIAMQNGNEEHVNVGLLSIKIGKETNTVSVTTATNPKENSIIDNSAIISKTTTSLPADSIFSDINTSTNSHISFSVDALRESVSENKSQNQSQNQMPYEFSPRPLNSSLEVSALYTALLFGLIAGFILNFMPCVLPVIALKVSAFLGSNQDEQTRRKSFREHNIFFALGIITWFMVLGLLLGLAGLSWGQLFQSPFIVLGLLVFIFAMSLSLFGLFHLPILDLRISPSGSKKQNEKVQAFTSGLMATLLATPCSGPLLGAVLGYSLTQSIPILLTIFFSMGLGMASPYVFFAMNPSLIRFMPKAGNWLNTMEQVLGFFLMATAVYLLSILPTDWHIKSLIILLLVAISAYIWGKWGSFHSTGIKKIIIALSCIALIGMPSAYILKEKEKNILWENFTNESFDELLGEEILLLKFTADWCPTCKVLEQTVFTEKNMQGIAKNYKLRFIYVDITQFNEEKQNLLKSLDSVSIPLLAVFPKGNLAKSPIIIRDLYTLNQLKEAIKLASE